MATTPTKPGEDVSQFTGAGASAWDRAQHSTSEFPATSFDNLNEKPSRRQALQALLAFSALHDQIRRRKALAAKRKGFETIAVSEFESGEQFVLDDVLQLVAERAIAITGADGIAIALAENNEIVLRASAGLIKPDVGARIDRDSAFSGACFRMAQIVRCDDTETDDRVNLEACRRLNARSMIAVPLCGRRRVIGVLEAFSIEPFGFNDSDVRSLELLAELVLGALKPEDEDRFAESAQAAATKLETAPAVKAPAPPISPTQAVAPPIAPAAITAPAISATAIPATAIPPAAKVEPLAKKELPPAAAPAKAAAAATAPITTEDEVAAILSGISAALIKPSAPAPVAPEKKTPEIAKAEIKVSITPKVASEEVRTEAAPEALEEASEDGGHRMLLWLGVVVVVALLAVGGWWKFKTAQLGNSIVQAPKPVLQHVEVSDNGGALANSKTALPILDNATPGATDTTTNSNSDTTSDAEDNDAPATPQEMSKFPRVTGIRHWSSATSSTVVLDLEDQVQYEAHRLANPDRIFFDLHDTRLAADLTNKSIEVGDTLLNRIRVAQPLAGTTRVVLYTKSNSNFSVSLEPNPYRLVVEVRKTGADSKDAVNLFPGADTEKARLAIVVPPPTKEDLQLRTHIPKMRIAVDAGHGGWDLGTVGRRGLLEKDLVLEVAQRLGKLLESRLGAEIIYTRQDDNYIPLDERAEIANHSQADLFVSVHANYSDLPSARGVETYYTNFFSTSNSKDKDGAKVQNTSTKTVNGPTLTASELHEKIEQSRRLAASVQRSLYGTLSSKNPGLRDRGVKEAGFVVLTETAMPGILAEVSFVSSPTDEQKLRSDGYREQIAEALYKGIAHYAAASHSGVKVASAGGAK
jgi:N-acetylmuramoyl-L-alanine amidase/putative methionine-R-sulfoxide reductase with GAF domain